MTKSNKKLIIPGCILILSLICAVSVYFLDHDFYFSTLAIYLGLILPLVLYCFIFSKTRLSAISYIISMAIPILIMLVVLLDELTGVVYHYTDVLMPGVSLFYYITALIVKFNHSRIRKFLAMSTVLSMVLAIIFTIIYLWGDDMVNLVILIIFVFLDISVVIISLTGSEKFLFKKSTILENKLLTLKAQYDNGSISEEEYKQKKAELINKL